MKQIEILTEAEKNRQIRKEAKISIGLYLGFFIWWWATGYGVAGKGTFLVYQHGSF
ncbi:MAG: DUF997 family protein [Anaerovoracaceae bacterium]